MDLAMSSPLFAPLDAIRREAERRCVNALNAGIAPDPGMHREVILRAAAERFDDEPDAIEISDHASFYATLLIDRNLYEGFTRLVAARRPHTASPAPSMEELAPLMARAEARLRADPEYAARLRVHVWPLAGGLDRLARLLAMLARNTALAPAAPEMFVTHVVDGGAAVPARARMRIDPVEGALAAHIAVENWRPFAVHDILLLPAGGSQEGARTPLARHRVDRPAIDLHVPLPAPLLRGLPPRAIPLPPAARFCFDLRFHHDVPIL